MSKRAREDIPDLANKRRAVRMTDEQEAFGLLTSNADDLIAALQQLQNMGSKRNPNIEQKIRDVSATLLPAFKLLAENSKATHQESHAASVTQEKRTKPHAASQSSGSEVSTKPRTPPVPFPLSFTPFQPEEIAHVLPPLPPIRDPDLEKSVFTHHQIARLEKSNLSYERLEWLGDAYSEMISSILLFSTFGTHDPGKLSQLRELLIRNSNLGQYASQYGLMKRVKIPEEVRKSKEKMKKVPGDVFEAYIAAAILSDHENGLQTVGDWLKALYSMTIKDQIRASARKPQMRQVIELGGEHGPSQAEEESPKQTLSKLVGVKGVTLRYEDDPSGPKKDKYNNRLTVYTVNLFLDGWGEKNKWLGKGTDLNKKVAGAKAAQMALDNRGLIKKYQEKKAAFLAARDAGDGDTEE